MIKTNNHNPGGKSKPNWPADSKVEAFFSPCGKYRHWLTEIWDDAQPTVCFLMMNPSVANLNHSDPTLRRTGNYARSWGYGGQYVVNMLDYRLTDLSTFHGDPKDLISPLCDTSIKFAATVSDFTVLAYGKLPNCLNTRAKEVISFLKFSNNGSYADLRYLDLCNDGITPKHPLYLKSNLAPKIYDFN